jgi:hypothetical protein
MNDYINEMIVLPKELVLEISSYFSDAVALVSLYSSCKHCKYCLEDTLIIRSLSKRYINKVIQDPTIGSYDETCVNIDSFDNLVLLLDSIMYSSPNCLKYHSKYTCMEYAIKTKDSAKISWLLNKTNMLEDLTTLQIIWRSIYQYWINDPEYGQLLKVIYDQCKSYDESCCLALVRQAIFYTDLNFILLNQKFLSNTYNKKYADLTFIKVIYRAIVLNKLTVSKGKKIIKNIELTPEKQLLSWIINIIKVTQSRNDNIIDREIDIVLVEDKIVAKEFSKYVRKILVDSYDVNPEKYSDCSDLINFLRKVLL